MAEQLIACEGVSKKFCRDLNKSLWYGVRDSTRDLLGRGVNNNLRPSEFWANKSISFELNRGDCLGLVGGNGAGKTTLLKILNGLIKPDEGKVTMKGRVAGLIALGAGFNPILTGRENILVNAAILGVSKKKASDCLDRIVEFADLDEFIDTPVRNYSSGMQVRLGFACAISIIEPDILIIDEVLAVGDMEFRNKCYRAVSHLRDSAAIIFVSHSMAQIAKASNRGIFLKGGTLCCEGDISDVITAYESDQKISLRKNSMGDETFNLDIAWLRRPILNHETQYLDAEIAIFCHGQDIDCLASISISDMAGEIIAHNKIELCLRDGIQASVKITMPELRTGAYGLTILLYDQMDRSQLAPIKWIQNALTFDVRCQVNTSGKFALNLTAGNEVVH